MDGVIQKCAVCEENQYKYRCPKCRILYCSVPCYKQHKSEGFCESKDVEVTKDHAKLLQADKEEGELSEGEDDDLDELMQDQLTQEQLNKLGESDVVKKLLRNPHLRALITHLDQSAEKDKAIEGAMQEPIFVEFADACLAATAGRNEDAVADR